MRKKLILLFLCCIAVSMCVHAEEAGKYEEVYAGYGAEVSSYVTQMDGYNLIFVPGDDAVTHTSTNIRAMPGTEAEVVATIDSGNTVKIWGYTDNGWDRVFALTAKNQAVYGYIRGDLLEPAVPEAAAQ